MVRLVDHEVRDRAGPEHLVEPGPPREGLHGRDHDARIRGVAAGLHDAHRPEPGDVARDPLRRLVHELLPMRDDERSPEAARLLLAPENREEDLRLSASRRHGEERAPMPDLPLAEDRRDRLHLVRAERERGRADRARHLVAASWPCGVSGRAPEIIPASG